MLTAIVSIASASTTDFMAYVGQLFTDFWVLAAVAIGIPLAFYVIKRSISLVPKAGGGGRRQ